ACDAYVSDPKPGQALQVGPAAGYFGAAGRPGLLQQGEQIHKVIEAIRLLNQGEMERVSQGAQEMARTARSWLLAGLLACTLLARPGPGGRAGRPGGDGQPGLPPVAGDSPAGGDQHAPPRRPGGPRGPAWPSVAATAGAARAPAGGAAGPAGLPAPGLRPDHL